MRRRLWWQSNGVELRLSRRQERKVANEWRYSAPYLRSLRRCCLGGGWCFRLVRHGLSRERLRGGLGCWRVLLGHGAG
jgi:hypothetical protein